MFDRLFNISKAYINHHLHRKNPDAAKYDDTAFNTDYTADRNDYTASSTGSKTGTTSNSYGLPQQVIDDLAVFGIAPPGSWKDVIQARNREMKKYHPDKYMNTEEKVDAANEIAQIYNAAFERLKKHFNR